MIDRVHIGFNEGVSPMKRSLRRYCLPIALIGTLTLAGWLAWRGWPREVHRWVGTGAQG